MPTAVLARPAPRRRRRTFAFHHVAAVGPMLPTDVLERVAAEDPKLTGLRPSDYGLAASQRLGGAITRSWNCLTDIHWAFTADVATSPLLDTAAHADPHRLAQPDSWAGHSNATARLAGRTDRTWLIGRRDICRSSDQRSLIAFVFPIAAINHTGPLLLSDAEPTLVAAFYAATTSFAADYLLQQKIGGTHVTYTYIKQAVLPRPTDFPSQCRFATFITLAQWLLPRVPEVTYTARDLERFTADCGYSSPPFSWDEDRRLLLRAELAAAFFRLYLGTPNKWTRNASDALKSALPAPRDALSHIMETFPIVTKKDLESFGTYPTQHLILEIYDSMAAATRTGEPYHTCLSPPSAAPSCRNSLKTPVN